MQKTLVFILSLGLLFSLTFGAAAHEVEEVNPHTLETSMTIDEIMELGDLSPEEVREEITLVGDLLNYLYHHYDRSGGNLRVEPEQGSNDHMWEFLEPAKSVIETKTANCAGAANLAAYLLENNYDEVGYFHDHRGYISGDPGGHVISYVKDGDNYIVFDPQQAIVTDTYVLKGQNLDEIAKYYAEVFRPRYDRDLAIVNIIKGEGFHSIKSHSDGADIENRHENMRLRYPYYYENRAWTAWEDPNDPLFLEFGDGPGFTPREYREYFRDDEEHYLYTPEASLRQIGAVAAGIAAILLILQ